MNCYVIPEHWIIARIRLVLKMPRQIHSTLGLKSTRKNILLSVGDGRVNWICVKLKKEHGLHLTHRVIRWAKQTAINHKIKQKQNFRWSYMNLTCLALRLGIHFGTNAILSTRMCCLLRWNLSLVTDYEYLSLRWLMLKVPLLTAE